MPYGGAVRYLPGNRDPKAVRLWCSSPAAASADVDRWWQSFLRRFDLEHTFRLMKQTLGRATGVVTRGYSGSHDGVGTGPTDHDGQAAARALAQAGLVPAYLVTLYDSIGNVTRADVGDGCFLDAASEVLPRLQVYGAVDVGTDPKVADDLRPTAGYGCAGGERTPARQASSGRLLTRPAVRG